MRCHHFDFLIFTDCSAGWVSGFNQHCFIFNDIGLNRREAETECENYDAHMVHSRSEDQNIFLASHMQSSSSWLGLSDEVTEGNFVWYFNKSINLDSYQNWNDHHPITGNAGENVDYVEIEKSSGKWNNINGNESIGNICMKIGMYIWLIRYLYSLVITFRSRLLHMALLRHLLVNRI